MNYSINFIKETIPQHKHRIYEIVVFTKGSGFFHASGRDFAVNPGKIVIVPPETTHYSTATSGDFERICIIGTFHQLSLLTSATEVLDNCANEGLSLAKMIYANRYSEEAYVTTLVNALVLYLLKNIKMEDKVFLAVKNIAEEINMNFYNYNIDITAMLTKSGYSEDYIRAHFKKITGKTPVEFLNKARINHACYLIDLYGNSLSLTEIAELCGFSDYIYFSRKFKQIMGFPPKKYLQSN